MKTQRGRWFADSDTLVVSYDNGRLMRIFSFPPEGPATPGEALAWISGTRSSAWLTDDDLRDLDRALHDLFGRRPASRLSERVLKTAVLDAVEKVDQ